MLDKFCNSCSSCVPEFYNGENVERTTGSRCTHISFFKDGVGKFNSNGEFDTIPTPRERFPLKIFNSYEARGYFYYDFIGIRVIHHKVCAHWSSTLASGLKTFEFYKDSIENYPFSPDCVKKWFADGSPVIHKKLKPLHSQNNNGAEFDEVSDAYLDYNSCQTCHYFEPEVDAEGFLLPFKGQCTKDEADEGIFKLLKPTQRKTYSFLGCSEHMNKSFIPKKLDIIQVPPRLFIFIDVNKVQLTIEERIKIHRFPKINQTGAFSDKKLQEYQDMDLHDLVESRRDDFNHNQFDKDFETTIIGKYFAKRVSLKTKEEEDNWGRFKHYEASEKSIFEDTD